MVATMAKRRTGEARPSSAEPEADAKINTNIDPVIRRQMDLFIETHNAEDEHPASIRSTVEGALKMYLRDKGFWPPKK